MDNICGRFFMLGNQPYNVYSMGIIHPIIRGIIPQNDDFEYSLSNNWEQFLSTHTRLTLIQYDVMGFEWIS